MNEALAPLATRRTESMFGEDVRQWSGELRARLGGSRVLVVGGAGSIGAATVQELVKFEPAALHVVDHNENALAELIRDLRSHRELRAEVRAEPLDIGSPVMCRLLQTEQPYDFVLNFAALKHVRSEKDVPSLLQLLDTNIIKAWRLTRWLVETGSASRYFAVSTDKAANPASLMGASKRIMEQLLFLDSDPAQRFSEVTSARFANVAFSNGSLLESFLRRLEKRQPVAAPKSTARFFISLQESGEICLLAAVVAASRHILIPRLDPRHDLVPLTAVAEAVLRERGFEPRVYETEQAARQNLIRDITEHAYPLLLTALDTAGEKPYEEFVGEGENAVDVGFGSLLGIPAPTVDAHAFDQFIARVEDAINNPARKISKAEIVEWMSELVPELTHRETGLSLDDRL